MEGTRDAASKVARYMPSAKVWITLGILDYELSDKPAALADVKKALALDSSIKRQFEQPPNAQPVRGQRLRAIIEDKEFVKQLLQ